jgi:hypothetical protein
MSNVSTPPPMGQPMESADQPLTFDPDPVDDGKRRRMLLLGGVGLAVLVVLVGSYFLFLKPSSSAGNTFSVPAATHHAKAKATPTASAHPTAAAQAVPTTAPVGVYRDPFAPIYPSVAASPTATSAPVDTAAATVSGGTQ